MFDTVFDTFFRFRWLDMYSFIFPLYLLSFKFQNLHNYYFPTGRDLYRNGKRPSPAFDNLM